MDAQSQEIEKAIDEQRPAAAVAERQRIGPQEKHRPDHLARQCVPDAGGVAHQEVLLEPPRVLGRHGPGRQRPESCRHAVDDFAGGNESLDHIAGFLHPGASVVVQFDGSAPTSDRFNPAEGQVRAGEDDGLGPAGADRVGHEARIVG